MTVVVLGGGLAGVACAHKLGDEGVEVVLVDHFMAEALHRLINEGDRFAETRGVMRR